MPVITYFNPIVINYSEEEVLSFSVPFTLELTFPSNYGGFIIVNPSQIDTEQLYNMDIETASTFLASSIIPPNTTINIDINSTTTLLLVTYTWNIEDGWGLYPSTTTNPVLQYVAPELKCTIAPDPSVAYTEPTDFLLDFNKGYSGIIVVNDCSILPDIPPLSFYNVMTRFVPRIDHNSSTALHITKPTKLTIYYYETSLSYYENVQQQVDTLYLNVEEKLNITIKDYGKIVSFIDTVMVELTVSKPCDLEIKLTNFITSEVSILYITVDSSLKRAIEIDESCLIEFMAIDGSYNVKQKYIFKKEQNDNKSMYTYYEQNGELTSNILETNTFDV
jgi:hypothetical protein